jgi:tetraacyldisaccharide 4'-kinase
VRSLLKPAELLYRGINRIRRALYRAGFLKARRLSVPVISVGGIAAGGSGKTPAVIAIARALTYRGLRVGVLTRGYRRHGKGGLVTTLDAHRFGDEPVLIKKRLPDVDVIVGENRYENAKQQQADIFILDDGFQHLQLHRDLDVVIDNPRARFLREGRSALRDADVVLSRRMRLSMPPMLRGSSVFAFAGLADNEQFFQSLRDAGFKVAGTRGFSDHHSYSAADLKKLKQAAVDAGAGAVVTTEKDAVKFDDASIIAVPAEFMIDPADVERIVAVAVRS